VLKYALLGFLNYLPQSGYDIKQLMDVSTSNFWHATQSQIYTTLKKLEKDKLVVSHVEPQEGRPDRRIYTIIAVGKVALNKWLAQPTLE
jgi:PadR family transcriptional regulator AphA